MASRIVTARENGLALISRINRWLIAGAVALSGAISVAAASAFHGRTRTQGHQTAVTNGGAGSSQRASNTTSGGGLQPPAQAPAPVQAPASGPVVSGGS
jgi:hypothetical protein